MRPTILTDHQANPVIRHPARLMVRHAVGPPGVHEGVLRGVPGGVPEGRPVDVPRGAHWSVFSPKISSE